MYKYNKIHAIFDHYAWVEIRLEFQMSYDLQIRELHFANKTYLLYYDPSTTYVHNIYE